MSTQTLLADTIAAIATPPGEGAIGIVRVSGPDALVCARRAFRRAGSRPLVSPRPRYLYLGTVVDPRSGRALDEALLAYFAAPRTYTGEDLIEVSCHGGRLAVQAVYEAFLAAGARAARPGELTLRAYLNGRIDLAQAEAVSDLIRARTDRALRLALDGLGGGLSERVRSLRAQVVQALAQVTARIDFPEDDVPDVPVAPLIEPALAAADHLIATARTGRVYREGVRLAIVGTPNAGKSSLLNRLLGANRAIVTEIPGTTRDTLEETLNIEGIPFVVTDTAGIRESHDPVERFGIERSRAALEAADVILHVIDASRPVADDDRAIARLIGERPSLLVANKSDLPAVADVASFGLAPLAVSALTGTGLPELHFALARLATGDDAAADDSVLVTNARHADGLVRARDHLRAALATEREGLPADFVSIDLRLALEALGEITGESATDDLLDAIFTTFCIGK